MLSATCSFAAPRCWLRTVLRNHLRPWAMFTIANIPTFAIGTALYTTELEVFGWNPYACTWINVLPMSLLTYKVNSRLPAWKDRQRENGEGWKLWSKFSACKTAGHQGFFALLVWVASLPAVWVTPGVIIAVGFASYIINHFKVFPPPVEAEPV